MSGGGDGRIPSATTVQTPADHTSQPEEAAENGAFCLDPPAPPAAHGDHALFATIGPGRRGAPSVGFVLQSAVGSRQLPT